jgi:hypothetical protein
VILGILVGILSDTVTEALQAGYSKRVAEVRIRRREFAKHRKHKYRYRKAIEARLLASGTPLWVGPDGKAPVTSSSAPTAGLSATWPRIGRSITGKRRTQLRLNVTALSAEEQESAAREANMPVSSTISGLVHLSERSSDGRPAFKREDSTDLANVSFDESFDKSKVNFEVEKQKQFLARVSAPLCSQIRCAHDHHSSP